MILTLLDNLTTLPNIITFASFAVVMIIIFVVGILIVRLSQDPIRDRLESLSKSDAMPPSAGIWEGLSHQLPQTRMDNGVLDRELRRAGLYRPTARAEFLGLRNGLVILALFVTGIVAVAFGPKNSTGAFYAVGIGLTVAACCWAIPRLILQYSGHRRVAQINESLPFSMDMLTMTMSGGLTLRDALYHVSRELFFAHPALAIELLIIRQHSELSSVDNAFEQFSRRIDSPDVVALSSLMKQGQRLGTDVVTSINEFADDLRLKRRQNADARSSRAAIQMLFPLTLLMVPAVMIILWGPAILTLVEFVRNFEGSGGLGGL